MWRLVFLALCMAVLIVPAVAMQFTDEVAWGAEDFEAAAGLLAAGWIAVEFIMLLGLATTIKAIAILGVLVLILLTWAHLAVGIF